MGLSVGKAQVTWINAGTGNWFNTANWSPSNLPGAGTPANIKNEGTAQVTSGTAVANYLYIGDSNNNGHVEVSGGAGMANTYFSLQKESSAQLSGPGSTWTATNGISVESNSSLTIQLGGAMTLGSLPSGLGSGTTSSRATMILKDSGSVFSHLGTLDMGNLDLSISNGASFTGGPGSKINMGGASAFEQFYSDVLVTGPGSNWTFNSMDTIAARILVQNGGKIDAGSAVLGRGTSQNQYLSSLKVDGAGSEFKGYLTLNGGTLDVTNGGRVTSAGAILGSTGGNGKAVLDGAGSSWNIGGNLQVAYSYNGEIQVKNGASLITDTAYLARTAGNYATVTVNGGIWTNNDTLIVAQDGDAVLSVINGGRVTTLNTVVGSSHLNGLALLSISGVGSKYTSTNTLKLQRGSLSVENGGLVACREGRVGDFYPGTASVNNATWTNTDNIYVGYDTTGTLTVTNNGEVRADGGAPGSGAGTLYLATQSITQGTLKMGDGGLAGKLNATLVQFGSGTASIVFNHQSAASSFLPRIAGSGTIQHWGNGSTLLTANSPTFVGPVTVYPGGTFLVAQSLGSGTSSFSVNGRIGGSGTLGGSVTLFAGAALSPGGDGGDNTLNAKSLAWIHDAVLEFDLGDPSASDKLVLSGALTKFDSGVFAFRFHNLPGYSPGTAYDIVTFDSTTFNAANFSATGPVQGTFQIVGKTLKFTPSTAAPTVASAAAASPNPVAATRVQLSVLGANAGGENNLLYQWSSTGSPAPVFSANGSNLAKNTVATFSKAGSYPFLVTITNPAGLSVTSAVNVTVEQTFAFWTSENNLTGNNALPGADPDSNGVSNLEEYAFGMDAQSGSRTGLPTGNFDSGTLSITYNQARTDLVYQPEWSTDLLTWHTENMGSSTTGTLKIASIPAGSDSRKFMRIRLIQLP